MRDVITLNFRDIQPPQFASADYSEQFTPMDSVNPQRLALIETKNGVTWFDSVNELDVPISCFIYVRYDPLITAEVWVVLDDTGEQLDILSVEDLDKRHEFMLLRCASRGLKDQLATGA